MIQNMKLHRFIGEYDLSKETVEIIDPKIIKQIKAVLRLEKGDEIILSDGKGNEAKVTLEFLSADKITGTVNEIPAFPARTTLAGRRTTLAGRVVNLYLAILKKENFELAVQKAVECGVSSITPIITERTIKTGLNIPRLEKIILEASEQCGQNTVPELFEIFDFSEAIDSYAEEKIIFHTEENTKDYAPNPKADSINIFIGPEGGFTEKEIELAKERGCVPASLGALTLRGETAAIIGTYRAVHSV